MRAVPRIAKKDLILLRHAKSSWKESMQRDFDRPLNRRGRQAADRIAAWLREAKWRPDAVLCSSAARTRETCDRLREALGDPDLHFERELYLAPAAGILHRLRHQDDHVRSVLVIGHNPGLQELAVMLSAGGEAAERARIGQEFPTAALARFAIDAERWRDLGPKSARLVAFVCPRDLAP